MEKAPFWFVYHNYGGGRILKIGDDFRSGTLFAAFLPLAVHLIRSRSVEKLNLFDVTFMDTDTMGLVKLASEKGVEVMWAKDSHVHRRYLDWIAPSAQEGR